MWNIILQSTFSQIIPVWMVINYTLLKFIECPFDGISEDENSQTRTCQRHSDAPVVLSVTWFPLFSPIHLEGTCVSWAVNSVHATWVWYHQARDKYTFSWEKHFVLVAVHWFYNWHFAFACTNMAKRDVIVLVRTQTYFPFHRQLNLHGRIRMPRC